MTPMKWIRTKIFRSVDPEKVKRVKDEADDISREARRLRQRIEHPAAVHALTTAVTNGKGDGRT